MRQFLWTRIAIVGALAGTAIILSGFTAARAQDAAAKSAIQDLAAANGLAAGDLSKTTTADTSAVIAATTAANAAISALTTAQQTAAAAQTDASTRKDMASAAQSVLADAQAALQKAKSQYSNMPTLQKALNDAVSAQTAATQNKASAEMALSDAVKNHASAVEIKQDQDWVSQTTKALGVAQMNANNAADAVKDGGLKELQNAQAKVNDAQTNASLAQTNAAKATQAATQAQSALTSAQTARDQTVQAAGTKIVALNNDIVSDQKAKIQRDQAAIAAASAKVSLGVLNAAGLTTALGPLANTQSLSIDLSKLSPDQKTQLLATMGLRLDGGKVISNDGGSVISNDGGSLSMAALSVSQIAAAANLSFLGSVAGLISEHGAGLTPPSMLDIAKAAQGMIGADSASLVAITGQPLITLNTSGLVVNNVATLLNEGGGQLVGNAGGTLVGNAGGTLVGNAGGTLVGNAGGTLVGNAGGTLIGGDPAGVGGHNGSALIPSRLRRRRQQQQQHRRQQQQQHRRQQQQQHVRRLCAAAGPRIRGDDARCVAACSTGSHADDVAVDIAQPRQHSDGNRERAVADRSAGNAEPHEPAARAENDRRHRHAILGVATVTSPPTVAPMPLSESVVQSIPGRLSNNYELIEKAGPHVDPAYIARRQDDIDLAVDGLALSGPAAISQVVTALRAQLGLYEADPDAPNSRRPRQAPKPSPRSRRPPRSRRRRSAAPTPVTVNVTALAQTIADMSVLLQLEKAKAKPDPTVVAYYQGQIDQAVTTIAADGPTARSQAVTALHAQHGTPEFDASINSAVAKLSGTTAPTAATTTTTTTTNKSSTASTAPTGRLDASRNISGGEHGSRRDRAAVDPNSQRGMMLNDIKRDKEDLTALRKKDNPTAADKKQMKGLQDAIKGARLQLKALNKTEREQKKAAIDPNSQRGMILNDIKRDKEDLKALREKGNLTDADKKQLKGLHDAIKGEHLQLKALNKTDQGTATEHNCRRSSTTSGSTITTGSSPTSWSTASWSLISWSTASWSTASSSLISWSTTSWSTANWSRSSIITSSTS